MGLISKFKTKYNLFERDEVGDHYPFRARLSTALVLIGYAVFAGSIIFTLFELNRFITIITFASAIVLFFLGLYINTKVCVLNK